MDKCLQRTHRFSFRNSWVWVFESLCLNQAQKEDDVVFFLHGGLGASEEWLELAMGISAQYSWILIDLPGFGKSPLLPGRLFSLLDYSCLIQLYMNRWMTQFPKEPAQFILVGVDFSTAIALLVALKVPDLISSLVLIHPFSPAHQAKRPEWAGFVPKELIDLWPGHYERAYWRNALKSLSCPVFYLKENSERSPFFDSEAQLLRLLPDVKCL